MPDHQLNETQIKALLDQLPNYKVELTAAELKKIQAKVLFVLGDQDTLTPLDCIASARKHLPESYLWIAPNTGHEVQNGKYKTDFIQLCKAFFDGGWKQ